MRQVAFISVISLIVLSTALVPADGAVDGTKKWEFLTGSGVESSPAIGSGGTIYVGSMDSKLYAINPDGTKKWELSLEVNNGISASPTIGLDGTIYVRSQNDQLYAIDLNGIKKWSFSLSTTGGASTALGSSPVIGSDGVIYVGSWDNKLYAINPDGTKKWEFLVGGSIFSSPATGLDGTIYVGSNDNKLYAINPDGTKKWEFLTGGQVYSSPAIGSGGTIYVGSMDYKLYAINPDGTKKWELAAAFWLGSPSIGSDGTIYVGSFANQLYAINPDGTIKWGFSTGNYVASSPGIGTDGTIYVGSDDNKLYAINPDGSKKWEFLAGGRVFSSPAIGLDGTIYVGSDDNKLYAINSSGALANTPWPKLHHDLRNTGRAGAEVVPDDPAVGYVEEDPVTQRVEVPGGADGNTTMVLRSDLTPQPTYGSQLSPNLEVWSASHFVPLVQNPALFDPNKPTLLLIHGWKPDNIWYDMSLDWTPIQKIGEKLSARTDINVLAWNWLVFASEPTLFLANHQRSSTEHDLRVALISLFGTSYHQKVHIFGHSLGAAVAVNVTKLLRFHPSIFALIEQLTLADAPEKPFSVHLAGAINELTWVNGTRRPPYVENLRSKFGASYEGITNVNFEYSLNQLTDVRQGNHAFGVEWYFGIEGMAGTLNSDGCPISGRYGANLSKVLRCSSSDIDALRAQFQDQPGDPVAELAMRNSSRPYSLDWGAYYSLSQLAPTMSTLQYLKFTLQNAGSILNGGGVWKTFSGGNVVLDQGNASGVTSSPVVLTSTLTLPTDILYMSFDVTKSTGLPNDLLGVYFDSNTLLEFSGEAFASSTETFSLGPIDISGYAGRTGALTFVYASTQPEITVTFSNLTFATGSVQPATPLLQPAASNINNIIVYPTPWQPSSDGKYGSANVVGCGTGLIFDNLTNAGNIRIYSIPGDLVREMSFSVADNGCKSWDGKNAAGRNVASGVYIAIIKNTGAGGGSSIKKLAIER